jgi:hypothetical protein
MTISLPGTAGKAAYVLKEPNHIISKNFWLLLEPISSDTGEKYV